MKQKLMIAVAIIALTLIGRWVCAAQETGPSGKPARCAELEHDLNIDLKEVVKAGCTPSQEQIAHWLDNPLTNLVFIPFQYDYITVQGPHIKDTKDVQRFQITPTFPISLGSDWDLINRVVFPFLDVPLNKGFSDCIDGIVPGGGILSCPSLPGTLQDPFHHTSGFGDMVYLGMAAPKKPTKIESTGATFIWGFGATSMFPTASESILGTGKYNLGPAAVAAYLGKEWIFGIFPQHWWSVGGDSGRSDISYSNIQYFIQYAPPEWDRNAAWHFGMSPNITINWKANGDKLTFPIGFGVSRMVEIFGVPVSVQGEIDYAIIHPDDKAGSRWDFRIVFTPVIPTFFL